MGEKVNLAVIFSCIAMFFGIVSVITSQPYNDDINITGVIVTVLCCTVALLVAWNIYSVVDTKDKIEKATELDKRIKKATNEMENNWQYDLQIVSRLFKLPSNATAAQRVAANLLVFYYSRKMTTFYSIFAIDYIYSNIQSIYEKQSDNLIKLAEDVSGEDEVNTKVVIKFYNEFCNLDETEQKKYKGVCIFLKHLMKYVEEKQSQ